LNQGQTYYWRVDEVSDASRSSVAKGIVWEFTVGQLQGGETTRFYTNQYRDDFWSNPENWTDGVPQPGNNVIIQDNDSFAVIQEGTDAFAQALYLGVSSPGPARLEMNGGTLTFNGNPDNWDNGLFMLAPYEEDTIATFNMYNGSIYNVKNIRVGRVGTGEFNMYDGYVETQNLQCLEGPNSSINLYGGLITGISETFVSGQTNGVNLSGGTIELVGTIETYSGDPWSLVIDNMLLEDRLVAYANDPNAVDSYVQYEFDAVDNVTRVWAQKAFPGQAQNDYPQIQGFVEGLEGLEGVDISWYAAENAIAHEIYFGEDKDAVETATTSNPLGVYLGQILDSGSPGSPRTYPVGSLELGKTYYWRIDEVFNGTVVEGNVWEFTVNDYVVIEDFETGLDGWSGNISLSSDIARDANSLEIDGPASAAGSISFNDWTVDDIQALTLFIHGDRYNTATAGNVSVTLDDGNNQATVYYDGYSDDFVQAPPRDFVEWNINLSQFAGIDLSSISTISINNPDNNILYVDDIRVYIPRYVYSKTADISGNTIVDGEDLALFAQKWLYDISEPEFTVWEFDMSTDPVGNGLYIAEGGYDNYNMQDMPGAMHITGATLLSSQQVNEFDNHTRVELKAQAQDTAGIGLQMYMDSNSETEVAIVDINVLEDGSGQAVMINLGDFMTAPVYVSGFAADTMIDITVDYYPESMTLDYVITDGSHVETGSSIEYTTMTAVVTNDNRFSISDFGGTGYIDYLSVSVEEDPDADFVKDGVVNFEDFAVLANDWMTQNVVWP
jgi:hypothetical protein